MWGRYSGLKKRSQELRKGKNATKQEKHLWYDFLRQYRPRFHRQVIIRSFIVDFYCPQVKLVIEVDGIQHFEEAAQAYDNERTAVLQALGCHVLRFTNREIDHQFHGVCSEVTIQHPASVSSKRRKSCNEKRGIGAKGVC